MNGYDSVCCFRNRHADGYRILLEITNLCNENCIFCHAKDSSSLSLEKIEKLFTNLGTLPIHDVILTGGEPLLNKELLDILEWFRSQKIECDVCTNGTLVDTEKAKKLANYLSEISISLDTAKPEVYDYLRGTKNGLSKVMKGIENCNVAGIDVHLTCVVTKTNADEIESVIELAKKMKVHSVSFLSVISDLSKNRPLTESIELSPEEKEKVLERINHIREFETSLIINTKRMSSSPVDKCRAGQNILGITSEGKILGCIMHRGFSFDLLNNKLPETMISEFKKDNLEC